ncbi:hypothetical protein AAKU67_002374 [Oxalobacteraceae bacterium GrIS 2.11]
MKTISALFLVLLFNAHAFAGDEATSGCKTPTIPIAQASDVVVKYFNKHREAYEKCITKFVTEQQEIVKSEKDVAKANAAHDAAEAAIKEYNNFMAQLKERNDRAAPDASDDSAK